MRCILCILFYAFYSIHCILCNVLCALCSVRYIMCVILYALYTLYTLYSLYYFYLILVFCAFWANLKKSLQTDRPTNIVTYRVAITATRKELISNCRYLLFTMYLPFVPICYFFNFGGMWTKGGKT